MAVRTFRLPDLAEGLEEAEIVAWHVSPGDNVVSDQPLLSVETVKAVVEVPAPWSGRVAAVHGAVGDIVKVGTALVDFAEAGESPDKGAVVGELEPSPTSKPAEPKPAARSRPSAVLAAPAVRALAAQLGVDLAAVVGTGPGGAPTRADIEAVAAGKRQDSRSASAAPPAGYVPMRGPRRAMALAMERAAEIAIATVTDEAVVDLWPVHTEATVRLVRAVAIACAAEPALNAWYDGRARACRRHDRVDLGLAVDSQDGLFVPIIRDAGRLGLAEIGQMVADLRSRVIERRLTPEAMRDATITLSNFGMIGGRHAALVVVPPQVAILGAGRIAERVVAVEGKAAVRRVVPLSLSFDHRAATGGEAARFLAAAIADLERAD